MLEQLLVLSAEQVAGARTPGKARGNIRHHGSQPGCVQLADRKVKVKRPRLRHKTEGEVKVPAYEMLRQDRGLGQHMLGALLRGVSTREYQEVLPQMAETVGVSRSAISRKAVEASAEQLKQLQERRWENIEILVIYIDGQRFGEHHILSAGSRGAGRHDEAGEYLRHGLLLALVSGVAEVALIFCMGIHLESFGQPPEVLAAVNSF